MSVLSSAKMPSRAATLPVISASVIAASIGFAHYLGVRFTTLGKGLEHLTDVMERFGKRNSDEHKEIKQDLAHANERMDRDENRMDDHAEQIATLNERTKDGC